MTRDDLLAWYCWTTHWLSRSIPTVINTDFWLFGGRSDLCTCFAFMRFTHEVWQVKLHLPFLLISSCVHGRFHTFHRYAMIAQSFCQSNSLRLYSPIWGIICMPDHQRTDLEIVVER